MSDNEHKMPESAEDGLPAKLATKEQPKKLPKSASPEESSEIQQLVNTLSQALKQSMAVSTETESKRNIPACLFGGSKFQNVVQFLSMRIWYISNHQNFERIC